jgi:hypothetical protein
MINGGFAQSILIFVIRSHIVGESVPRRHPCPSEEHGGGWVGSSTKTELGAPRQILSSNTLYHENEDAYL